MLIDELDNSLATSGVLTDKENVSKPQIIRFIFVGILLNFKALLH